jgi:hypothetical protein
LKVEAQVQYSREGIDPRVAIVHVEPIAAKLAAVREAMSDPLFLADLQEVADDFKHVDPEA